MSESDNIFEDNWIRMFVVTDDMSLMVISTVVEKNGLETYNLRVSFLKTKRLERFFKEEAD